MRKAYIQHIAGAAVFFTALAIPLDLAGVTNAHWIAAAVASATYYGREVSQCQEKHARALGIHRSQAPLKGWFIWEWSGVEPILEFILPTITAAGFALVFQYFK